MEFESKSDRFGNLLVTFDDKADVDTLKRLTENHPEGKAVIFYNLDSDSVTRFNSSSKEWITYQSKLADGTTVHLYRNGSTCPELCNERVYAAGVQFITKFNDEYYTVVVGEPNKRVLLPPGGTVDNKTFDKYGGDLDPIMLETAIREVDEECNIVLAGDKLEPFCEFNFLSSYFGITDIPDTYRKYICQIDYTELSPLFDDKNLDSYGNYSLAVENPEIDFIHAIPLSTGEKLFDVYKDYEKPPFVSGLHLTMACMYLQDSPNKEKLEELVEKYKKRGLQSITFINN